MNQHKMALLIISFLFVSTLFVSAASASLVVKPAKLGILRLTISPLFPAKATGSFEIGNKYNSSINVNLYPNENISAMVSLSEQSFTLQPNETKKISFTVTVDKPGQYIGDIVVDAKPENSKMSLGYQLNIIVFASQSSLFDTNFFIGLTALAIIVIFVVVYFKFLRKIKIVKIKRKPVIFAATIAAVLFLLTSSAMAANVAMVVKDTSALSEEHEKKIYDILNDMDHTVTLVDKNTDINFFDYDLIVIAGRPSVPSSEGLDSFVTDVPVNDIPTIATDYNFLDDWGWTTAGGRSSYGTSGILKFYVQTSHPIMQGFNVGDVVDARTVTGYKAVDMLEYRTNFKFVASADSSNSMGIITYAPPNTPLKNGDKIAGDSAAVFIGVNYPFYWSAATERVFRNSVNWLLALETDPPTTPVLTGPQSATKTATYQWNASSDISGIQKYEFQLSKNDPDFTTTLEDVDVLGLQYTASGLRDGNVYYARVRAVDNYDNAGDWSNVVSTVVDYSDISIKINSPAAGAVINLNDTVHVNVDASGSRLNSESACSISIGGESIAQIPYDTRHNECKADVTIPSRLGGTAIGATSFTATIANYLGTTKSDSVAVFLPRTILLTAKTDKSSYTSGEDVTISGVVSIKDNNATIKDATVTYNVSNKTGSAVTNANGQYSFKVSGLAEKTHTANVKVSYNGVNASSSTSFTISAASSSSSSSSSQSSSSSGSYSSPSVAMTVEAPEEVSAYAGEDAVFTVKVTNEGSDTLHYLKINLVGLDISADIFPDKVDLYSDDSQEFEITLHIPEDFIGEYDFNTNVISYETSISKKIHLSVTEKEANPEIEITNIDVPELKEGEAATIKATISNVGDSVGQVTLEMKMPEGWTAEQTSQTVLIYPTTDQTISFTSTPASGNATIEFVATYMAGEEKSVSKSVEVEVKAAVKPEAVEGNQLPLTGMLVSVLTNPLYVAVFSLGASAVILTVMRKSYFPVLVKFFKAFAKNSTEKAISVSSAEVRRIRSPYERWEAIHKVRGR